MLWIGFLGTRAPTPRVLLHEQLGCAPLNDISINTARRVNTMLLLITNEWKYWLDFECWWLSCMHESWSHLSRRFKQRPGHIAVRSPLFPHSLLYYTEQVQENEAEMFCLALGTLEIPYTLGWALRHCLLGISSISFSFFCWWPTSQLSHVRKAGRKNRQR